MKGLPPCALQAIGALLFEQAPPDGAMSKPQLGSALRELSRAHPEGYTFLPHDRYHLQSSRDAQQPYKMKLHGLRVRRNVLTFAFDVRGASDSWPVLVAGRYVAEAWAEPLKCEVMDTTWAELRHDIGTDVEELLRRSITDCLQRQRLRHDLGKVNAIGWLHIMPQGLTAVCRSTTQLTGCCWRVKPRRQNVSERMDELIFPQKRIPGPDGGFTLVQHGEVRVLPTEHGDHADHVLATMTRRCPRQKHFMTKMTHWLAKTKALREKMQGRSGLPRQPLERIVVRALMCARELDHRPAAQLLQCTVRHTPRNTAASLGALQVTARRLRLAGFQPEGLAEVCSEAQLLEAGFTKKALRQLRPKKTAARRGRK